MQEFLEAPVAESCRLVAFGSAEVIPGVVNDTWFLSVAGMAPCLNMKIRLVPRVYVLQPDWWGIDVVGCLPGFCLTAVKPYTESLSLTGITGHKGIEVIGANRSIRLAVPAQPSTCEAGGGRLVLDVRSVAYAVQRILPPVLIVDATGTVTSTGWTNPRLTCRGAGPTPDGYQEFDFVADPPSGLVAQVIMPVRAHLEWKEYADHEAKLQGVRVYGQLNHAGVTFSGG